VTQAIVLLLDQRFSQKSCLPRATFSGVNGLSAGMTISFSSKPKGSLKKSFSWAPQLALLIMVHASSAKK